MELSLLAVFFLRCDFLGFQSIGHTSRINAVMFFGFLYLPPFLNVRTDTIYNTLSAGFCEVSNIFVCNKKILAGSFYRI